MNKVYTEEQRLKDIERFESIVTTQIHRQGITKLMQQIKNSDFYIAPASIKYHCCYKGGLLEHSLHVYDLLHEKLFGYHDTVWTRYARNAKLTEESIAIIALFHDLCKIYTYVETEKNFKNYDKEAVRMADKRDVRKDSKGKYIWDVKEEYMISDQLPYGHGEKSVMLIERSMRLKLPELFAIRWHMGFSDANDFPTKNMVSDAMRKYPLCLALHEADQEATYCLENDLFN